MQIGQNIKLKRWDPQILFRSLRHSFTAILGVGAKQLELNGIAFSNVKTVKKTVGAPGVAGCDFNFTSANNITEQVINLGAIIPAFARVLDVKTVSPLMFATRVVSTASRAVASNVATIKTATAHNYVTGVQVSIAGMTDQTYNGTHTITVVDATTFTYSLTHADEAETPDTAGTVLGYSYTLVAETGTSSSGNQLIASATIKADNAVTAANLATLNIAPVYTAQNVYFSATPGGANWSAFYAGKVEIYVTYIESV